MADRVPLVNLVGALDPWIGTDLPLGTVGSVDQKLKRGFLRVLDAPTSAPLTAELRDASSVVMAFTIPIGQRSVEPVPAPEPTISAGTALFLRVTADGGALGLSGWYEREDA